VHGSINANQLLLPTQKSVEPLQLLPQNTLPKTKTSGFYYDLYRGHAHLTLQFFIIIKVNYLHAFLKPYQSKLLILYMVF